MRQTQISILEEQLENVMPLVRNHSFILVYNNSKNAMLVYSENAFMRHHSAMKSAAITPESHITMLNICQVINKINVHVSRAGHHLGRMIRKDLIL